MRLLAQRRRISASPRLAALWLYLNVWLGQLLLISYALLDSLVVGHVAPLDLGALTLGNSLYVPIMVTSTAVLSGTTFLIAREHRATSDSLGALVARSFVIAIVLGAFDIAILQMAAHASIWRGAPLHLQVSASMYLNWLSIGVLPSMLFRVTAAICHGALLSRYGTALQALGLVTKCIILRELIKLPDRLTVIDACGISTAGSFLLIGLLGVVLLHRRSRFHSYRPRWIKELLRLRSYALFLRSGIPFGLSAFAELSAFAFISGEISHRGAVALAAHQIASNVMNVGYSFISAFAIVTSVYISRSRRVAIAAMLDDRIVHALFLSAGLGLILMALCLAVRPVIVSSYTSVVTVSAIGNRVLPIVACVFLFDSLQSTAASILRANGFNLLPTCIQIFGLWLCGVFLGSLLVAFPSDIQPSSSSVVFLYWFSIAIGMLLTAAVLCRLAITRLRQTDCRR